ncbi:MAG: hypothetical protein AB7P76_10525 [Candidatus Melainabacteria bacterium]
MKLTNGPVQDLLGRLQNRQAVKQQPLTFGLKGDRLKGVTTPVDQFKGAIVSEQTGDNPPSEE